MSAREPIGYTNEVPGNETTAIVPVYELTDKQAALKARADALRATIEAGDEAQRELDGLQDGCAHHVHRDVEGWPYDSRYCVLCGADRGLV